MQLSARNQLSGKITAIHHGSVNDEVIAHITEQLSLVSIITTASVKRLKLSAGDQIVLCIKASHILLGVDFHPESISARNCLLGKVKQMTPGAVNTEVTLALNDQLELTSIITNDSAKRLQLALGKEVYAIIKASDVLIAKDS